MSDTTYDVSARADKMTTTIDVRRATEEAPTELSSLAAQSGGGLIDVMFSSDAFPTPKGSGSADTPTFSLMRRGMRIGTLRSEDALTYAQLNRVANEPGYSCPR